MGWGGLEQHEGVKIGVKLAGDGVGEVEEDPITEGLVSHAQQEVETSL